MLIRERLFKILFLLPLQEKKAMDIFGPDAKIVPMPEKDTPPGEQKKSAPTEEVPPFTDEDFEGLDDAYVPSEED